MHETGKGEGSPSEPNAARPARSTAFQQVEAHARNVLREKGLSDNQIEIELHRVKRSELERGSGHPG